MPIVVVGTEKNFAELRPRVLEGRVSTKAAGVVADAIREANPHADLDKLEPGTVLVVPEVQHVARRGELSLDETTRSAVAGLANHGKEVLAVLAQAASARESALKAERKATVQALDAGGVAAAARKDKTLAADLKAARKALEEEEEELAKERAATLKKARAEWAAGLDALRKLAD